MATRDQPAGSSVSRLGHGFDKIKTVPGHAELNFLQRAFRAIARTAVVDPAAHEPQQCQRCVVKFRRTLQIGGGNQLSQIRICPELSSCGRRELQPGQFGIKAALRCQALVCALFDNPSLVHHDDPVSFQHGGKAVGDHQGGASFHQMA